MKEFYKEPSTNTPLIKGNLDEGHLLIKGKSFPENSFKLYEPLLQWCKGMLDAETNMLKIEIKITYMNSSTGQMLMDLFRELIKFPENKKVEVEWHYEADDTDMKELVLDCQELYSIISAVEHANELELE
jgi:hypothetical protein